MKTAGRVGSLAFALALLGSCSGPAHGADVRDSLRKAVDRAIDRVKPALVQIHVVAVQHDEGREKKYDAFGSGVIIDKRGYVLTNHHVAGHPARLFCILSSREEIEAELVGTDALSDIAVIRMKTDGKREFPRAVFGDSSKVRVGDRVLAMGSPVSISQSATLGIVSNTEMILPRLFEKYGMRFLMDGEDVGSLVRWIAHDAAIYGGNSGGPLINLAGEVIGVNEISIGLGGAIPSAIARPVAEQIMEKGAVTRAWLGLEVQPLLKRSGHRNGALVGGAIEGSPAEQAGFLSGDVLLSLDGEPVNVRFREQMPLFQQKAAGLPIGKPSKAVVLRNGKETTLEIVPVERQPMEMKTSEWKAWGIAARNISFPAAKELKRDNCDGVLAQSIRPGGPCGQAKPPILAGDIIVSVGGDAVLNVDGFREATRRITEGRDKPVPVLVEFERKAEKCLTVVKVGIEDIEDPGAEVKKAWLDAATQVLTADMARQLGIAGKTGVRVTQVYKGGKAEDAGLRAGDLIVRLDGETIPATNPEDSEVFPIMVRRYKPGAKADLTVMRGGLESRVQVELVRAPMLAHEMKRVRNGEFDFTVRDIAFLDKTENKWEQGQAGVYVEEVVPGGWAAVGDLAVGDVILEAGGESVADADAFEKIMDRAAARRPASFVLQVLRGVHRLYVEIEPDWSAAAGGLTEAAEKKGEE